MLKHGFYPKLDSIPYSSASEKYSKHWEYFTKLGGPYNLNKPYIVELMSPTRTRLVMRPFVPECLVTHLTD